MQRDYLWFKKGHKTSLWKSEDKYILQDFKTEKNKDKFACVSCGCYTASGLLCIACIEKHNIDMNKLMVKLRKWLK